MRRKSMQLFPEFRAILGLERVGIFRDSVQKRQDFDGSGSSVDPPYRQILHAQFQPTMGGKKKTFTCTEGA